MKLTVPLFSLFTAICLLAGPQLAGAGKKPIRFGATSSFDGKYAEPSAMLLKGYKLWEQEVNQRGGLLGRPVEIVVHNDHSRKSRVREAYSAMFRQGDVDLVLAPYSTSLTMAALKVCRDNNAVLVASGASGAEIWNQGAESVFGVYALAERYFIGFLDLIARQGLSNVAVIFEDNLFNRDAARGVQHWAPQFGLEIKGMLGFVPGTGQLHQAWQAACELKPQALIVCSYPPAGHRLLKLMEQAASRPDTVAMAITPVHPDFAGQAGPIAENIFAPSQWEPNKRIPFPGTQRFIQTFQDLYDQPPSYHAASAYAACQVLEKAIVSTQSLNQTRIRDFIRSLDTVTAIGRFKVDHTGKQVGHNPLIVQWQGGKKQIVYPPRLRTAVPRFEGLPEQTQ